MNIYIIRHAESDGDILYRHEGRANFKLTDKGIQQAKKVADFLKKDTELQHAKMYVSPLYRTMQTADEIKNKLNLNTEYLEELMEWNNGILCGLERDIAKIAYPFDESRALHESVLSGESELEFRYRCEKAISKILKDAQEKNLDTIFIVSHGGTISNLLNILLKLPSEPPPPNRRFGRASVILNTV